jgi:hypothetical protein
MPKHTQNGKGLPKKESVGGRKTTTTDTGNNTKTIADGTKIEEQINTQLSRFTSRGYKFWYDPDPRLYRVGQSRVDARAFIGIADAHEFLMQIGCAA